MLFDKFQNKTTITGIIEAIDPIHIGSSGNEELDPTQVDNCVLKDSQGKPFIPGSSLKGIVRSNFEAVIKSIGKRVCNVFDDKDENCLTTAQLNSILKQKEKSQLEKSEECYEKSCEACKLFGGRGIASKIEFKDCTFIGEECIFEYRDGVGIDRETGAAKKGVKYDFEIIPKGTCFNFYMTAENLDENQQKYLNYILKILQKGELCVGGKTSRGLGRIRLKDVAKNVCTIDDLKELLG